MSRRTLESYFAERQWRERYAAAEKEARLVKAQIEFGIIERDENGMPARWYPYVGSR